MVNDEDLLDWVIGDLPMTGELREMSDKARSAIVNLRLTREQIARTRSEFAAMGDTLRDDPRAAPALKELGIVVETLDAVAVVLEKGLRR